jgi:hypothetical protein
MHVQKFKTLDSYYNRAIDSTDAVDLGNVCWPWRRLSCLCETVADLEHAVYDDRIDALVNLLLFSVSLDWNGGEMSRLTCTFTGSLLRTP